MFFSRNGRDAAHDPPSRFLLSVFSSLSLTDAPFCAIIEKMKKRRVLHADEVGYDLSGKGRIGLD